MPVTKKPTKKELEERIRILEEESIKGRLAEEALRESEKKYRQLFMNAPAAFYEIDYKNHCFLSFNESTPAITGYSREELMQMDPWDLLTEESLKVYRDRLKWMKEGVNVPLSQEYAVRKKDGGILWMNISFEYTFEDGLPVRAAIVAHDITARKLAEAALLESEIKFKSFVERAFVGAYIVQDGILKYVNPKFAEMFGYTVDECLNGMPVKTLVFPEDLATVNEQINRRISGGVDFVHYAFRGRKKSGQIFDAEIYGSSIVYQAMPAAAGTILDITERRQAEVALKEAEERYHMLFESSPMGIVVLDPATARIIEFNETAHRQLGYSREEFARLSLSDIEAAETSADIENHIAKIMKEGRHDFETRHRTRQGEIRNIYVIAQYSRTSAPPVYHCIWHDITEQKQAEAELAEAHERLDEIVEHLPDATFVIDVDGRVTAWNKAMERMTGVGAAEMLDKGNYDYALPFYGERRPILIDLVLRPDKGFEETYIGVERQGNVLQGETYVTALKSGPLYLYATACAILDASGNIVGAIESIRDITDRKHAEEALRESEEKFRILADSTPTAIMLYQGDRWIYANRAAAEISGYSAEELLAMNFWDIVHPKFKNLIQEEGRKRQAGEKTINRHTFKIVAKDGREKWVDLAGAATMIQGKLAGIISVSDITGRKRMEDALQASEEKYRALFDSAGDAIFIHGPNEQILAVNAMACEQYGYTPAEFLSMQVNMVDSMDQGANVSERISRLLERGRLHFESVHRLKNGSLISVDVKARRIMWNNQMAVMSICRDITKRKRADEEREKLISELQQALAEIKTLTGLLPICSSCKKIRDDKGYWNQIESYLAEHSMAEFTHGICPECAEKLYPNFINRRSVPEKEK